jgi:tRNA pseudouridine32 synthase/23S rRNA pseudouridine746 synthase
MASNQTSEISFQELFVPLLSDHPFPNSFPNPMNYPSDPLGQQAAQELLKDFPQLIKNKAGLRNLEEQEGKMLGVLVVLSPEKKLGYLRGFSGKLMNHTRLHGFVPPVHDLQKKDSFFPAEEKKLEDFTRQIQVIRESEEFITVSDNLTSLKIKAKESLDQVAHENRTRKKSRRVKRKKLCSNNLLHQKILHALDEESKEDHYRWKDTREYWNGRLQLAESSMSLWTNKLEKLQSKRKQASKALQRKIFSQYSFLNIRLKRKNLWEIFSQEAWPPTGAGDCAGPKLFQTAFLLGLKPISLVEFWYGAPLPSEVRHHGYLYPACKSKCRPILSHMLEGMNIQEEIKPKIISSGFKVLYEDDELLAIDKPPGVLSVPGRQYDGSVATWVRHRLQSYTGPIVLHRLDMATSGILLLAKTTETYHQLQQQFIDRSIQKTYTAIIDGIPEVRTGVIDLPLSPDWNRRPAQRVDPGGKASRTRFRLMKTKRDKSLVLFFPETGRTHQIRVHSSHPRGLNCPIQGDQLYGRGGDRLLLHATKLQFVHPITGRSFKIHSPCPFDL